MLYVKTKKKDLHKAVKALKRLISKRLKVRRCADPEFEENFVRKQCYGRFTFRGDPTSIRRLFEERGFTTAEGMAADQKRIRLTKTFRYREQVYTARVVVYPDMKKLAIIAMAESETAK